MTRAAITGTGFYVPDNVVTNDDLTQWMETSDAWITERSGIKQRRWLRQDEDGQTEMTGAAMGAAAARMAIAAAGIEPADIDLVLYATLNPDLFFPGNGVFIEDLLGLKTAGAMDIRNQCTGFIYGLAAADGFIRTGTARTILLIGAEIHSTGLDISTEGRDTAALFGDGAGAVVVQAVEEDRGVIASVLHSQGRFARELMGEAPVATVRNRINQQMIDDKRHFATMNGSLVFKHATRRFCESIDEVLDQGRNHGIDDVALLIPHQANQRITDAVASRLEIGPDQGLLEHRQVRQHHRGVDPHRPGRGGPRGPSQKR